MRDRRRRQVSLPPVVEYITVKDIPRYKAPPAVAEPVAVVPHKHSRVATEQEMEIERLTKKINENITSYQEMLKKRQNYTIPVKKTAAVVKPTKRTKKWSNLYTTMATKTEESEESEEEDWVTVRKQRSKRHLVVPSSEMSRGTHIEHAYIPDVYVSHRLSGSAAGGRQYNTVHMREIETSKIHPLPKPHFEEEAEFDSGWHAISPHVRSSGRPRVVVGRAKQEVANTFDKRTPAADDWMIKRTYRSTYDDASSTRSSEFTGVKRHLVTPEYTPRRGRRQEPLSSLMLEKKVHSTRHHREVEEEEEPFLRRLEARSTRHNLALPSWTPGSALDSSTRTSRREAVTAERSRPSFSASPMGRDRDRPSVGRGRSITPIHDSAFSSTTHTTPVSLGRRASVSYFPATSVPMRETRAQSTFSTRFMADSSVSASEHHIHPMRDTFVGAVQKVRETMPWRQVYNESMHQTHKTAASKFPTKLPQVSSPQNCRK